MASPPASRKEGPTATQLVKAVGRLMHAVADAPGDLPRVLEQIAAHTVDLCRADYGYVFLRDGEEFRLAAAHGGSDELRKYELAHPIRAGRETIVGRVVLEGHAVLIDDAHADADYRWSGQRLGPFRALLAVPISGDDGLRGVLGLARTVSGPFTHDEIGVVSLLADQAAMGIELARLFTELRESLDREKAVGHVLQTIGRGAFDLQAVLQTVIESAVTLSRADYGDISRLDEPTGFYQPVAWHGPIAPEFWNLVLSTKFGPGRGTVMGRALMELRPVHILDVLTDPEYTFPEVERLGGYRTALAVPILRDGLANGVIFVSRMEVRGFSEREVSLLTTFADQAALAIENVRLFEAVERQRTELARFAPQVASLLSSHAGEQLLAGHRRQITALFCDLRGFTSFAESAEPEEVLGVLRAYHAAVGELAVAAGGTVEHFAGDGLMVFFNDPVPLEDHELVAVRTAVAMRERFGTLAVGWRKRGYELGLGIGIGVGYATLGRIGFEGRYDYGAVGNVVIQASRLSDVAKADQILITQRVYAAVEEAVEVEPVNDLVLKGISKPVTAFAVRGLRQQ